MCEIVFVWPAPTNMFDARTRIETALWVVSVATVFVLDESLFSKMPASEESQNVEKCLKNKTKSKTVDRRGDWSFDRFIGENSCLWGMFCAEFQLKDKRERAYSSMEQELDISVSDIKNKIVGLARTLASESKLQEIWTKT